MLEVSLSGVLRDAADGDARVTVEASTIRELFRKLGDRYPAMRHQLDGGIAVSINGQIFRDRWSEKIPADAEVFLLPRIPGG